MANTKISAFTAETDVANITGFAAYKTAGGSSTNVRISGSEIESTLNLDNFAVGTLAVGRGGTGQTSYTDGQLLIGNTSTGLLSRATLTEGSNITITDGNGSITIASSLPLAANGTRGGIQIGYTENGKNYPLELNNEKAFVNVPWTDTTDNATGSAGELQYTNGSGVFQATPDMVYSTNQLKVQNTIYLDGDGANAGIVKLGCESAGASHYVGLEGPTHGGANSYIIKFPDADPAVGKILKVNSFSSDKAVMEWADAGSTVTESFIIAASDETTGLTTGTGKATFRMPYAFTLTGVRASVTTAPVGSVITIDINESGTSVLSTKITIDAGEKTSTTAAVAPVISDSALSDDAEITIDIDTVGSSTAGTGLKVTLIGNQ